ncbi:saccharopine dehydrogenase NADP-binding domain-containing protein [Psychrobium sp. MM17-31]|uniref:saccharopine dehydrogenase C-terminal domain-containing protein n=1 Tax=Psychrobium sp. MM17-31 TaxID=2917758 RepID=UPI001EF72B8D|nr:saccharopine dehydrogenase C-terminal domain-containing protein [Psychrobium sp. MM17-31]MCG7532075.1 saccharopine dehydrogenase NADP-binding domain-containing protein [Psychrobium sp. MM17-31]
MKTIHWLGAGLSSLPGIKKIALSPQPLILWNRTLAKAQEAVDAMGCDVAVKQLDWDALTQAVSAGDVVVSMLPATMHLQVAELCLARNAHFVSSSYISPEMQALDAKAKAADLCFVNEVGLDPGLDHLLAHALVEDYQSSAHFNKDNQHFFRSYCGGFPSVANDFKYKFSWSPLGVLKALKSPAQWIENGEQATTEKPWLALQDYQVTLADGTNETFQAYPNRDSVPFVGQYGMDDGWNVQQFVRGTLRLNGWAQAWDELFTQVDTLTGEEGMAKLAAISDELWDKYQYNEGEADRVVLSVELEVKDPSGENTVFKQAYGIDEIGNERGSAMARLVSLTVAIAIESLLAGELPAGVSPAPHKKVIVDGWLEQLAQLNERVFVS